MTDHELSARAAVAPLTGEERDIVDAFTQLYFRRWNLTASPGALNLNWLGHWTLKAPTDLWVYQEILVETRPDVIIETGTHLGGSALFLASICELIGNGRVISVDILERADRPRHPRLTYVTGNSADPAVIARVQAELPPDARIMVILDSDHRRDHVAAELALLAPLVTPGCYLVVEDGVVNGHPVLAEFGVGPFEALEDFLRDNGLFEPDATRERFMLTLNPGGYLRRRPSGPTLDHDAARKLTELREILIDLHGVAPDDGSRQVWREPTSLEERIQFRLVGKDWPRRAETMIGMVRLQQFQDAITTVVREGVPGDILEAGVWRGGASILARAVLAALGCTDRTVWLADSFAGLPEPKPDLYPADSGAMFHTYMDLAVSREDVEASFARHGLLDRQVRFLEGWFSATLPAAPVEKLAVLRLDGDMYESTWVALESLYDRVSPGGFVIVDDWALDGCRAAVEDFRRLRGITQPMVEIDWTGRYWRKPWRLAPRSLDFWHGFAVAEAGVLTARAQARYDVGDYAGAEKLARDAVAVDANALPAHGLLARLKWPGPSYSAHLAHLHALLQPETYLEIGVAAGGSLSLARPGCRVIAIDPAPWPEAAIPQAATLLRKTSDDFFREDAGDLLGQDGFDLAFVDGDHSFPQVLRDILNLERHAAPGAVIAVHDVLPLDEVTSSQPRRTSFYSGDGWKAIAALRRMRPDLRIDIIATEPTGLAIIRDLNPNATMLTDGYESAIARFGRLEWRDYIALSATAPAVVTSRVDSVDTILFGAMHRPGLGAVSPARRLAGMLRAAGGLRLRQRLREDRDIRLLAGSAWFDPHFYRRLYPDVASAGIDPLIHYVRSGWREERQPHRLFDSRFYLAANPDVRAAGVNPLVHFLRSGQAEGRAPRR